MEIPPHDRGALPAQPEYSLVIPVFNGSRTLRDLMREIHDVFRDRAFEVVLVNDGSTDDSEATCAELLDAYPGSLRFVQLARNFGEHNAVLAGLRHARGAYVGILDDDGQHPPAEALRLFDTLRSSNHDVVYGRYRIKHHNRIRNLGSWMNDALATLLLKKPRDLYLSSFKVMTRFVVDQITTYRGARPYIDGLIYRVTRNIGQVDVIHRDRRAGSSNYGPRKLVQLWLNMLLNFSILPLRLAGVLGLVCSMLSGLLLLAIILDRLLIFPNMTVGVPTILVTVVFFAGVQLLILGTVGEYLGRLFLDYSGTPQVVVRYVKEHGSADQSAPPP
jgi:glycosyltransferase involved in cell wall biosynthesis